jgi:uncharacterized protein
MGFQRISRPALVLAALLLFACELDARAQQPRAYSQSPLPPPTGYVNDFASVIDDATEERLERMLTNLKDRAGIEFAVVTVPTTGGQDIFSYSLAVARGWGIGAPDGEKNGLLLLVAVQDRKYQVQVSRHLEGDLPDGLVGEIGRRMREPFRNGDYSKGIETAVQTFIATIGQQRGFTLDDVDPALAYKAAPRAPSSRRGRARSLSFGAICLMAVVVIIIFSMLSGSRGRGGRGGGGSGCLNALLLANLFSSLSGGRDDSSGWGGFSGGDSGWGGGGGGGFGGFGGGGDFGGGGAGGDW